MLKTWTDPALSWNSSDYGNFTQFICPRNLIWTPDITIYNAYVASSFGAQKMFYKQVQPDRNFREKLELTGIVDEEKMIRVSKSINNITMISCFLV